MSDMKVSDNLDKIELATMNSLKDFQKATVCRIDELYRQGQMRILVSDEVGLGKTFIARGAIAKIAQLQKEKGDNLVKVAYICSNSSIAEQNLTKLCITSKVEDTCSGSSRLSMQHLNIFWQESNEALLNNYIQLIPLTPDTSFRITSGTGTVEERALMFAILRRITPLTEHIQALDIALKDFAITSWDTRIKSKYEEAVITCNEKSKGTYLPYILDKTERALATKADAENTYSELLLKMCRAIENNGYKKLNNNYTIGKLRYLFAQISLDKLEPDFVIMDEFQRFRFLLNSTPDTETGMLANKFFNSDSVKMLLLSATPYKMYSTIEEIDDSMLDEHFSEFFDVMNFLNVTQADRDNFKTVWNNYSVHIREMTVGSSTVIQAKQSAEDAMYRHVCRTERVSASENADIIDDSDKYTPIDASQADIVSYLHAQKLLEEIAAPFNVPVDYIKSTPYLLSFMKDYQLKKYLEKYFSAHPDEIKRVKKDSLWLKRHNIDRYESIPSNNAKLDKLKKNTFKDNAEMLLWVPASLPYYPPRGVFKNITAFSKTLIFSSWEMVPRMISVMLSYEAERNTIGKLARLKEEENQVRYFHTDNKRYPSARLNFSAKDGKPSAMTLFCLIYPCQFLTDCYNPTDCLNRGLSLRDIEKEIKLKINEKLCELNLPDTGNPDSQWYYIAPLLFDEPDYVNTWFDKSEELYTKDDKEDGTTKIHELFKLHLEELKNLYDRAYRGELKLGKKPKDLVNILTDMAISSPAIVINRTYKAYSKLFDITYPSQIAKLFINRMNSPEATATIELACGKKPEDIHWKSVLTYAKQGNIQAVFDEYAHLLTSGAADDKLIENMHEKIKQGMNVRTTRYNVDTFNAFNARANGRTEIKSPLRSHFAVAFTKGDDKEADTNRKVSIRNSFNSPFRPFVLASTSIGQEGLDFHNYCRKIVHWNLPSNPIDLEQREGRISRFECLAIRQNIAKRYGSIQFKTDVWKEMFLQAQKSEKCGNGSDLTPFWGLTPTDDMIKIERIVPMYRFSKDIYIYERLIKILSLYRLTLGQARQEELLDYFFRNCEDDDIIQMKKLFINLSPFYRESLP